MRKLPPLNAIRAFEAAARHLSFTAAANELCVTITAVSHQVKNLEDQIGCKLFERTPREVRLTSIGARLFPALREGFDRFGDAFEEITAQNAGHSLTVTTTRAFAERWLMPRLARFTAAFPDISVNVEGSEDIVDLRDTGTDIAIRYGRTADVSLATMPLLQDSYHAVTSANDGLPADADISAYRRRNLLAYRWHLHTDEIPNWSRWLRDADYRTPGDFRISWFNDESLAMHAMERGMGPLLCCNVLAADGIAAGNLRAIDGPAIDGFGFKLAHVPTRQRKRSITLFVDWIVAETEQFALGLPQTSLAA
ncbi:LysR family transcriptional regulator (plasmid) [Aminobacter sp. SR38]|jgi:LysR family glycine cleavage system transcriptional activator|uniref:LysR family transcriptional regulator n=1 Tax=Aminobacter sp. SR38 TaxID=2774562 RepID=UPI001786893A|nr:LysR family transcriptional regulator [Aminobacter sp. SR38]QOF75685.1 LysR family transcriptional regulator [Aminobacter sp. SR38]